MRPFPKYTIRQSLICVVDETLPKSIHRKLVLPNQNPSTENLSFSLMISIDLSKEVVYSSDQNSSEDGSGFFDSFKAEKYLSTNSTKKGLG